LEGGAVRVRAGEGLVGPAEVALESAGRLGLEAKCHEAKEADKEAFIFHSHPNL
jgi:hypothetical protein